VRTWIDAVGGFALVGHAFKCTERRNGSASPDSIRCYWREAVRTHYVRSTCDPRSHRGPRHGAAAYRGGTCRGRTALGRAELAPSDAREVGPHKSRIKPETCLDKIIVAAIPLPLQRSFPVFSVRLCTCRLVTEARARVWKYRKDCGDPGGIRRLLHHPRQASSAARGAVFQATRKLQPANSALVRPGSPRRRFARGTTAGGPKGARVTL
jgi:hypothetical protein